MRKLIWAFALTFLPSFVAAQSITTYDYHKAPNWLLMQQYLSIYFDTCLAEKDDMEGGHRLSIGRAISGSEAGLPVKLDMASARAKRGGVQLLINSSPVLASLMMIDGNNVDLLDVPATDLMMQRLGLAPSGGSPQALTVDALVGKFNVRGRNPNGNYYYGTAETAMEGGNLKITWTWDNGKTDTAVANLLQNVLAAVITGYNAPAVYTIGKDRVWRGNWDNGRATEVVVPRN